MIRFLLAAIFLSNTALADVSYRVCDVDKCDLPKHITINLGRLQGVHSSSLPQDTVGRMNLKGETIKCSLKQTPKDIIKDIIRIDLERLTYLDYSFGFNYLESLVDSYNFVYYECDNYMDFYAIDNITFDYDLYSKEQLITLCDFSSCTNRIDLYFSSKTAIFKSYDMVKPDTVFQYYLGLQKGTFTIQDK